MRVYIVQQRVSHGVWENVLDVVFSSGEKASKLCIEYTEAMYSINSKRVICRVKEYKVED